MLLDSKGALDAILGGKTVQCQEFFINFSYVTDKDIIKNLGDDEEIYCFRKNTGQFMSIKDFMKKKVKFKVLSDAELKQIEKGQ